MRFTDGFYQGQAVLKGLSRRSRPTPMQIEARKFAYWLHLYDGGYDPMLRCNRPHSQREIASLFGVDQATVCRGLVAARKNVARVEEVACA